MSHPVYVYNNLQPQQSAGDDCCRLNRNYPRSPKGIIRALKIVFIRIKYKTTGLRLCLYMFILLIYLYKAAQFVSFIGLVVFTDDPVWAILAVVQTAISIATYLVVLLGCVSEPLLLQRPWNIFVRTKWTISSSWTIQEI